MMKYRKRKKLIILLFSLAFFCYALKGIGGLPLYAQQISFSKSETEAERGVEEGEIPTSVLPDQGELTIEECINITVENHPPLKTADKQIELAKLKVTQAWRNLLPSLSLKWDEAKGVEFTGSEYVTRKYGVEGKQPLFHGGELHYVLEQAKVNLTIAQENKKRIKSELNQSVKRAFYSLARAKETLKRQENLLDEVKKIFNSVSSQHQQGLCAELEFLDVGSKYNEASFQFTSAHEDLKLAELILRQVMNIDEKQPVDIEYSLEFERDLEIDLDTCLSLALINRPGIKIRELVTEFTEYGKKIASAKKLPKVDITGSYGYGSEVYKDQDMNMDNEWYVGTKVTIPFGASTAQYSVAKEKYAPGLATYQGTEAVQHSYRVNLFDNLKIFSTGKEADIDHEQARHELNEKKEEVALEVKEAFFAYEKALIQIDAAKSKIGFRSKEVEIFKLKRSYGELMDSQVIESLIKLTQEQFSYVQAVTDYYTAIADLNEAIGIDGYFEI